MIESVLQVFDEELAEKRLTFKESDDIVKQKQLVGGGTSTSSFFSNSSAMLSSLAMSVAAL